MFAQLTKKTKEFSINAIGFTLMHIDLDGEFHDSLMEKAEKWFWPFVIYAIVGIICYLI